MQIFEEQLGDADLNRILLELTKSRSCDAANAIMQLRVDNDRIRKELAIAKSFFGVSHQDLTARVAKAEKIAEQARKDLLEKKDELAELRKRFNVLNKAHTRHVENVARLQGCDLVVIPDGESFDVRCISGCSNSRPPEPSGDEFIAG